MSWTDHLPGEHVRDSLSNYRSGAEQEGEQSPRHVTTVRHPLLSSFPKGVEGWRQGVCPGKRSGRALVRLTSRLWTLIGLGHILPRKSPRPLASFVTRQLVTPTSSPPDNSQVLPAAVVETVVVVLLVVAAVVASGVKRNR